MSIAPGYVEIRTADPPMRVLARLDEQQPKVDAGFGGWDEVPRPRRSPLTSFRALPGIRLTLPIMLDQWASGASIEKQIADLQLMGRPVASNGEPPQVKVSAAGGSVPYQARTWVVDSLTFGDALLNPQGNRVRQQMVISLLEYVQDVYLAERSAAQLQRTKAATAKTSKGASAKRTAAKAGPVKTAPATRAAGTETLGAGETLVRIAARELGDATRWIEIADLNDLRDPRYVPFGQVIRLP